MNPLRIVGIILFLVGLNASDSVADRMSNFFTGRFTETTMWYMIGGIVLAGGGGLLAAFGRSFGSDMSIERASLSSGQCAEIAERVVLV